MTNQTAKNTNSETRRKLTLPRILTGVKAGHAIAMPPPERS